jgi:hypothetical protein
MADDERGGIPRDNSAEAEHDGPWSRVDEQAPMGPVTMGPAPVGPPPGYYGAPNAQAPGATSAPTFGPSSAPPGPARTPNPQFEAAKDTASAVFGEVRSAVTGASKREPYALLALASAVFALIWLVWPEDDELGAERLKLWTVFVLLSVALLFTPMVRRIVRMEATRAWQFSVGGACGLGFAWVAFLLPRIDSNQAFFGTLAAAAAGLAAWTAPGRPETT